MGRKCFYEVLEIAKDSDVSVIRKAYKRLALTWHPDKNPDNKEEAEKMFKSISQAYEVLSDDKKRQKYDKYGHEGLEDSNNGHSHHHDDHDFDAFDLQNFFQYRDPNEIFREFFGGDPFENLFGMPSMGPRLFDDLFQPFNAHRSAAQVNNSNRRPGSFIHHHLHHHHSNNNNQAHQHHHNSNPHRHHHHQRASRNVQPYTLSNLNNVHHHQHQNQHHNPHADMFSSALSSLFNPPVPAPMMMPNFSLFSSPGFGGTSIHIAGPSFNSNMRSTSTSTRYVNGRLVKTTKITENGSETVIEEVDGVVVNKTINGTPFAFNN